MLVLERMLAGTNFLSQFNIVVGNVLLFELEGKLAHVIFSSWCIVVVANTLVLVLKKKISFKVEYLCCQCAYTCARRKTKGNNAMFFMLEGKLPGASFPSYCNVFLGNALVILLKRKLGSNSFPSISNIIACSLLLYL